MQENVNVSEHRRNKEAFQRCNISWTRKRGIIFFNGQRVSSSQKIQEGRKEGTDGCLSWNEAFLIRWVEGLLFLPIRSLKDKMWQRLRRCLDFTVHRTEGAEHHLLIDSGFSFLVNFFL